jgi:teichoic acid transport system ATP-binding protein
MNELAISVKDISKRYEIYERPVDRLKQSLFRGKRQFYKEVWALKDVFFDLPKGEVIGIIGMNGAGKSTLLQILAGILHPTSGEVIVRGNVMSLLELGSGFNPEFTGRENIYYYGMLMGQAKRQIETNINRIIDFADISDFIDQPIKTYSSGMVMRLAFSVITNSSPDILLVDEVMSVGDINFQMKCMRWMDSFRTQGGTICIVPTM